MDGSRLTPDQLNDLKRRLVVSRDNVGRILQRMKRCAWYSDDPVRNALQSAWHALHAAINALPREPANDPATGPRPSPPNPDW